MTILKEHSYPDLEVNSLCHCPALVEIKCPATLIGRIPSAEELQQSCKKNR